MIIIKSQSSDSLLLLVFFITMNCCKIHATQFIYEYYYYLLIKNKNYKKENKLIRKIYFCLLINYRNENNNILANINCSNFCLE
jgi:hypothetical protein